MSWLKTSEERNNWSLENPNTPLGAILTEGMRSAAGKNVTENTALGLSAFFDGVRIIAGDLATVPLKLYARRSDGGKDEERGHAVWPLVHDCPAPMLTSAAWRDASQGHLLMRGNSYSLIEVSGRGQIEAIYPLNPKRVTRRGMTYEWHPEGGGVERIPAENMLHVTGPGGNGVDGWSVLTLARESLGLAMALEESNATLVANAARPSGFLSAPDAWKPEAAKELVKYFNMKHAGSGNVGKTPFFDKGVTWQQVGMSAEDAQFLQSREFQVKDVARWLNIPIHKLKEMDRATFNNVEQMATDYVQGTLRPWVVKWEQHLNAKLLTDRERERGLFVQFVLDGLMRGDVGQRGEWYMTRMQTGSITPNEIRSLENQNPLPGGDRAFVQVNMIPLDQADTLTTQERQALLLAEQGVESRADFQKETGSPDPRLRLRDTFRPLFTDAAQRMVNGEARDVMRLVKRTDDDLKGAIERYYFDDHPVFAAKVMGPVFRSYADSVTSASAAEVDGSMIDTVTYSEAYSDAFVARYAADSRRLLSDKAPEEIEQRLDEWKSGTAEVDPRHVQVANREIVKLAEAVSTATFFAAGVLSIVWRLRGDTCPYCRKLDGMVVGIQQAFIPAGTPLEVDDAVPLVPKTNIRHAPAHRGCDCYTAPRF